jgi:predicted GNAT family acetyltransferase
MNEISDNKEKSRFELEEQGHTAYADYRLEGEILTIRYVFAPEELRGSGAAGRLMQGIVERAQSDSLKIVPVCGYAAAWLRKHTEYHGLLA